MLDALRQVSWIPWRKMLRPVVAANSVVAGVPVMGSAIVAAVRTACGALPHGAASWWCSADSEGLGLALDYHSHWHYQTQEHQGHSLPPWILDADGSWVFVTAEEFLGRRSWMRVTGREYDPGRGRTKHRHRTGMGEDQAVPSLEEEVDWRNEWRRSDRGSHPTVQGGTRVLQEW